MTASTLIRENTERPGTVKDLMNETGEKRGTVEAFRSMLQKYKLISNNQPLGVREKNTFKQAQAYKTKNSTTWSDAMEYAIQQEYGEEMHVDFYWSAESIVRHLIWLIKNHKVTYSSALLDTEAKPDNYHAVYESIIDNFKYISESTSTFKGSLGTDGSLSSVWTGADFIYYVVGKYNHVTGREDIHIFYNEGTMFNIMRCKYICGGYYQEGFLSELHQAITEYHNEF